MNLIERVIKSPILQAIKIGFINVTPLTMVASVFVLIANFPIKSFNDFMVQKTGEFWTSAIPAISNSFYYFISLFILLCLSYQNGERLKLPPLMAMVSSLMAFFALIPIQTIDKKIYLDLFYVNQNGIFMAILCAFLIPKSLRFLYDKKLIIKLPSEVPKEVVESFATIVPLFIVLAGCLLINLCTQQTVFEDIPHIILHFIQEPITHLGSTLPAVVVINFGINFLWFFGFNGSYLFNSIMNPVFSALSIENINALSLGIELPNIITATFQTVFISFGGCGSTLTLIIAILLISKNENARKIAKLSLIPGIFNINEPIVYGIPIILNPILFVPFVFCPVINTLATYFAMHFGIVNYTNGIQLPWTLPVFISGFLASGVSGLILQIFLFALNVCVYIPFVQKLDTVKFREEEIVKNKI